jgi:hypothetical protein
MDYTIKLQTDGDGTVASSCMQARNNTESRDRTTESKFYLPVGVNTSFEPSRLKRIWAALFDHRV